MPMTTTNRNTNGVQGRSRERDRQVQSADRLLQVLVGLANAGLLNVSITLTVGGSLVSGILIGDKQYSEEMTDAMREAVPPSIKSAYAPIFDVLQGAGAMHSQVPGEVDLEPAYIHLKEARFLAAGIVTPADQPVLWRGRVAAVDGFFLGHLSEPEESTS